MGTNVYIKPVSKKEIAEVDLYQQRNLKQNQILEEVYLTSCYIEK